MRAWQLPRLGDPWRQLEVAELPAPAPTPATLRVAVEAADLNFADILQCQGTYQVRRTPPFTPGMSAAGTVLAAGPEAAFAPGARVVGPTVAPAGGYAEQALLLAAQCHSIPDGVATAAAMAMHVTHATAWFAFHHRGGLRPSDTVLVLAAAGGVGSAAVEMARAHGCWVAGAAGGGAKTSLVTAMGADLVIDYDTEDLYQVVMDATDGRGVDVVFDPVGGHYFDIARRLVAWEGRLLIIGFASGVIPSAPANHALVKNYSLVGVHMGGYRDRQSELTRRCYADLHQRLAAGELAPLITETIGFDALPDALQRLANRATSGRVIFDPGR